MNFLKSLRARWAQIWAHRNYVEPREIEQPKAELPPEISTADANRATHVEMKKNWDSAQQSAGYQVVPLTEFTVDDFGNVYYINAAALHVCVDRMIEIERATLSTYFGLDANFMQAYNEAIQNAIAAKDLDLIATLQSEFIQRQKTLPAVEKLLILACLYLYRHDENPYIYDPVMQQNKLKTAQRSPYLRGFFLRLSWGLMVKLEQSDTRHGDDWSSRSEIDFLQYSADETPTRAEGLGATS